MAILSTKFGYGRPAAFALAFAAAFFCGDNGFDLPNDFGLCFSQTGLAVAIVNPLYVLEHSFMTLKQLLQLCDALTQVKLDLQLCSI
jgi:hypothetical protein